MIGGKMNKSKKEKKKIDCSDWSMKKFNRFINGLLSERKK